jgi:hypothetical protein
MSDFAGKQSQTGIASGPAPATAQSPTPGKRTLVDQLPAVQQRGNPGAPGAARVDDESAVHDAAARGTATSASPLPHGDLIQRAFGRHDVSSVQAHAGPDAAASARDMGAQAYASGNHVVLGDKGGDLFTVAHEAAHVVQQRGGVQLRGGVGSEGDTYERHADDVAARVVAGQSAEGLLDRFSGAGSPGAATGGMTQRKINVGGKRDPESRAVVYIGGVELASAQDVDTAWEQIKAHALIKDIQVPAREVLSHWVVAQAAYEDRQQVSENRGYPSYDALARAIAGEVQSGPALAKETKLAQEILMDEGAANAAVGRFIERLKKHVQQQSGAQALEGKRGRYAGWAYGSKATYGQLFENVPSDVLGRVGFVADYSLSARGPLGTAAHAQMPDEMKEARDNHHNVNENAEWVVDARQANVALSAGPSATTTNVLALARTVAASQDEINGLAWGLFAIWNIMPRHVSGTHRFHEVMGIAQLYNVPYQKFKYPETASSADFEPPQKG